VTVVVTGAAGFLGRHVVAALRHAGHEVRAIVRPRTEVFDLGWDSGVQVFRADLRTHRDLAHALEGAAAVVHLAAAMSGNDFSRFSEIVLATERLFDAMSTARVKRLVLCSSFSVYDWLAARGTVDETLPLAPHVYECGFYAAGKLWQERLARRRAEVEGWQLTVLRPGFIWGPGNPCPPSSTGRSLGRLHLVFGPRRCPPFIYVENCAEAFRAALENPEAIGATVNVVDDLPISAWRFLGAALHSGELRGVRVPVPLVFLSPLVALAHRAGQAVLGPRARLPSFMVPVGYAQGYRSLRYDTRKLQALLGQRALISFEEATRRTFAAKVERALPAAEASNREEAATNS